VGMPDVSVISDPANYQFDAQIQLDELGGK
jgi:hypothetical protein